MFWALNAPKMSPKGSKATKRAQGAKESTRREPGGQEPNELKDSMDGTLKDLGKEKQINLKGFK